MQKQENSAEILAVTALTVLHAETLAALSHEWRRVGRPCPAERTRLASREGRALRALRAARAELAERKYPNLMEDLRYCDRHFGV